MIHNPLTLPLPDLRHLMNTSVSALEDESMRGSGPSMGRITGSASIETLVRVGIEKENGFRPDSKMVVIHDFMPCVDDELEVKRGQVREREWAGNCSSC